MAWQSAKPVCNNGDPGTYNNADHHCMASVVSACVNPCMRLQLELILTAATLCVAIIGVISGLFGMNLHNTHEDSYFTFVLVSCLLPTVTAMVCV